MTRAARRVVTDVGMCALLKRNKQIHYCTGGNVIESLVEPTYADAPRVYKYIMENINVD